MLYEGQPQGVFPSLLLFLLLKGLGLKFYTSASNVGWWRWVELNYRSTGYEPVALTSEPHRQDYEYIIHKCCKSVKSFFKIFLKYF